ncbi:WD repeat-containing 31 isoform X1, partial [Brachionus plicatilis]
EKHSNEMNGLRLIDTLSSYDNVLSITTAFGTKCLFGHQNNYTLELFDYVKGETVKVWNGHEKDITRSIYCPRIDRYLSCSRDKTIKLWNSLGPKPELDLHGHELVVTTISVDNENMNLISGSRDNSLKLWDLRTGKMRSTANISRNLVSAQY